ncbi:MAG: dephospho-CoA kinase, partial [Eubacteriales bacterium]
MKIGLTGGIGSGKTTAAARFAALGACVYHADEVARHALDPGAVCYDRVVSEFGQRILNDDGTINRKKLGEIV